MSHAYSYCEYQNVCNRSIFDWHRSYYFNFCLHQSAKFSRFVFAFRSNLIPIFDLSKHQMSLTQSNRKWNLTFPNVKCLVWYLHFLFYFRFVSHFEWFRFQNWTHEKPNGTNESFQFHLFQFTISRFRNVYNMGGWVVLREYDGLCFICIIHSHFDCRYWINRKKKKMNKEINLKLSLKMETIQFGVEEIWTGGKNLLWKIWKFPSSVQIVNYFLSLLLFVSRTFIDQLYHVVVCPTWIQMWT